MSFWEILFNVVAFAWSPAMITVYGFIVGIGLFATFMDDVSLEGWEIVGLVIAWLIVSVLVWTFLVWWTVNGYSGFGWHYPVGVEEVLR